MPISSKTTDSPAERYYTTAPVDYDWGWTTTIIDKVAVDKRGRPLRLVEIADGYHADYQVGRYASGLHVALPEAEYQKQVGLGLLTPTPGEEIHTFAQVFDLSAAVMSDDANARIMPILDETRRAKGQGVVFRSVPASDGHPYRLAVTGKKDEAKAMFDAYVQKIEAALKV